MFIDRRVGILHETEAHRGKVPRDLPDRAVVGIKITGIEGQQIAALPAFRIDQRLVEVLQRNLRIGLGHRPVARDALSHRRLYQKQPDSNQKCGLRQQQPGPRNRLQALGLRTGSSA